MDTIELYTDIKLIPDMSRYVKDNEAFFNKNKVIWDDIAQQIISFIDRGKYNDEYTFLDRWGVKLYNSFLSTGSKTLLNIHSHPEYVYDFREAGMSCAEFF